MAKKFLVILAGICFFLTTGIALAGPSEKEMMVKLGDKLMFDKQLSTPPGQSCADCHTPRTGWTGPIPGINKKGAVYPGAIHQRTGNRRPPTAAYASTAPIFDRIEEDGEELWVGGNFWDGRATGETLGNPAADQAMGPFLNPVEQNNPDEETVVYKVCNSTYSNLFKKVAKSFYNEDSLDICASENTMIAYNLIASAIAVFEDSPIVNQFTSKFDAFLEATDGEYNLSDLEPPAVFTQQEWEGFQLFVAENDNDGIYEDGEGGMCAACHVIEPATVETAYSQVKSRVDPFFSEEEIVVPPLFTDYTFDNLGTPKNPDNPFYEMDEVYVDGKPINPEGADWIDPGLAGHIYKEEIENDPDFDITETPEYGLHKVPTLRNVDKRPGPGFAKSFMHNGAFKSLKEVVHFYNTRDKKEGTNWPDPEVAENVNEDELGNLGLSDAQEDAIVAFMQTLSDGYRAKGKNK